MHVNEICFKRMLSPVSWKHKRKQCKIFRKKILTLMKSNWGFELFSWNCTQQTTYLQNPTENTLLTNDYKINTFQLHAANWLLTVFSLYETHKVIFSRVTAGQVLQNTQLFDLAIFSLSFFVLFMNIQIN